MDITQYTFLIKLSKLPFDAVWLYGSRAQGDAIELHMFIKKESKKVFDHIKLYFPTMKNTYEKLEEKFYEK